ncbi:OBSCN-like protein [Mya arenaria]|uniref:OBSCN-like protein n=1 Tax=Mya arenaria TaxID=6604 RepID=A0ABY7GAN2_MYAAR|nr:OBSCN-like protein [Mya arenaria]
MNYDLSSGKGYAVLLVYEKFKHANNRKGADIDLKNMQDITKALGLEQINQDNDKNLTRVDTLKVLKDAYSLITENDCQMFVFMISTHGKELPNPAASGQKDHALSCSDDEMIFLSTDVVKMFSEHNCPILKGKPKLFFIQACRSIDPTWYMVKGTEMMYPDCRMHITEDKTKVSVVRKKDTTSKTEQFIPDDSISRVSARRIKKDGNEEDGLLMLKKRWEHILWKCSSHVTGVDGDETEVDAKGRNESASKVLGFTSPLSDNYKHTGTKNVVLSCETFSQEVKWEKDGKLIHSTTRVKIEDKEKVHQLTFAELEYGDSGIYICSNTDEKLTRISLIVGGFKKPLQDIYTNTGTNDVILSCENNIQNVKWEKDGKPIVSKDGKPIESTTRVKIEPNEFVHQLTFTEVEYGDTGTYTCSSSERWSTSASLIVGGFKKPLRDEYAKTGAKNVIFSCETYSPNVNWEKDGKPIGSTTRVKIEQKGFVHQLIFTEVEYGDTGNYTCSTPEGRTTSSTLIVGVYDGLLSY